MSRRRRMLVGSVAALAVTAVVAVVMTRTVGVDTAAREGGPGPAVVSTVARVPERTEERPLPSEEGAREAGIAYATAAQDWLYLTDDQVAAAVAAIATEEAGPSLASDAVAELRSAREALAPSPGRVWLLVRPLATRVERYEPPKARVVVWTVRILSAADVALPQAEWMRVGLDLAWTDGSWRLQSMSETPGPTPINATTDQPWQPEALDEALDGFRRVGSDPTT